MGINKNGVITSKGFITYHTEPDGSIWQQVFCHSRPDQQRFNSNDSFSTGVYHNSGMWLDFSICKKLTSWEFLTIQHVSSGSPVYKYRWIQSKSPFNATWEDVEPTKVTKNTSSGYTAGTGGFYVFNSSIYMCCANASKGNWYGVGSWTLYQGGYPSVANAVITDGSCSVFVRIDNTNLSIKHINNIIANNFVEV